jgi:hypothetical protein
MLIFFLGLVYRCQSQFYIDRQNVWPTAGNGYGDPASFVKIMTAATARLPGLKSTGLQQPIQVLKTNRLGVLFDSPAQFLTLSHAEMIPYMVQNDK